MTGFGPLLPAAGCPVIAIAGFPNSDDQMSASDPEPTFERQRPLSWRGGPLYLGQPTPLGEVRQDRL